MKKPFGIPSFLSRKPFRILVLLILPVLSFTMVSAQNQDFRSWWNVDLSKDISKDVKAGLELSQRFKENSLRYDRSLATLGLEYEVIKNLSLEGGFRYIAVKDNSQVFVSRYRLHGNVSYDYKLDRITLKIRERVQYGFNDLNSVDDFYSNSLTNRTRFSIDYDIFGSPFSIRSSYELFVDLNDPEGFTISDHRLQAGLRLKLNSKSDLDFSYMFDMEVNKVNPLRSNVLILTLGYDL